MNNYTNTNTITIESYLINHGSVIDRIVYNFICAEFFLSNDQIMYAINAFKDACDLSMTSNLNKYLKEHHSLMNKLWPYLDIKYRNSI